MQNLRRSSQKKGGCAPAHIVSAFAARQRLVLGQVKVADKSNEITAIPKLLAMMDIQNAIVTIDAMGCQRDIARGIIDRRADYILALKGNQGTLRDDVELFVAEQKAKHFKDVIVSRDTTVDGDHGRIETRTTTVLHQVEWLDEHRWPGLKSVIVIDSRRDIDGKIQTETRLFITSLVLLAHVIGPLVRSHWAIENSLHWVMDMVFRDDECRVRTDHAPANLATIKHMALNLTRLAPGKDSLRVKRKVAAWTMTSSQTSSEPGPRRSPDCPVRPGSPHMRQARAVGPAEARQARVEAELRREALSGRPLSGWSVSAAT